MGDGIEIGYLYGYRYAGVDDKGRIMIYMGGKVGAETILADNAQDSDRTILVTDLLNLNWHGEIPLLIRILTCHYFSVVDLIIRS